MSFPTLSDIPCAQRFPGMSGHVWSLRAHPISRGPRAWLDFRLCQTPSSCPVCIDSSSTWFEWGLSGGHGCGGWARVTVNFIRGRAVALEFCFWVEPACVTPWCDHGGPSGQLWVSTFTIITAFPCSDDSGGVFAIDWQVQTITGAKRRRVGAKRSVPTIVKDTDTWRHLVRLAPFPPGRILPDIDFQFLCRTFADILTRDHPESLIDAATARRAQVMLAVMLHRFQKNLAAGVSVSVAGRAVPPRDQQDGLGPGDADHIQKHVLLDVVVDYSLTGAVRRIAWQRLLSLVQDVQADEDASHRPLQQTSVLLTYNGPWGLLPHELVGMTPDSTSMDDLTAAVADLRIVKGLVGCVQDWVQQACKHGGAAEYAVSLELCPETWASAGVPRVHMHAWLFNPKHRTLQVAKCLFMGQAASHASLNGAWGGTARQSQASPLCGAYYLSVSKLGQVWRACSMEPHCKYPVKEVWVTHLYSAGKISAYVATEEYMRIVGNAQRNVLMVDIVERRRRRELVRTQRLRRLQYISAHARPFVTIPCIVSWIQSFSVIKDRYPFLVLDGPSCVGKTRFASALVPHEKSYYCDCSNDNPPDLRDFTVVDHDLIILDELSGQAAIKYKKLLQASSDWCKLGCSPTQQHTYDVFVGGVRIVVATNTWTEDLKRMPTVDAAWLIKNSVYVRVDHPLWIPLTDAPLQAQQQQDQISQAEESGRGVPPDSADVSSGQCAW